MPFDRLARPDVDPLALPDAGVYITNSLSQPVAVELAITDEQGHVMEEVAAVDASGSAHLKGPVIEGWVTVAFRASGAADGTQSRDAEEGWHYRGTYHFASSYGEPSLLWLAVLRFRPPEVWVYELVPPTGTGPARARRWRHLGPNARGVTVVNNTEPAQTLKRIEVRIRGYSGTWVASDLPPEGEWAIYPAPSEGVIGQVQLRFTYSDGRSGHGSYGAPDCRMTIPVR